MSQKRFKIALSFADQYRDFVSVVASHISKSIGREQVFYDRFFEAELARPDLDIYLQNIYHNQSELLVIFICDDYEKKEWCGLEWRAIRNVIKRKDAHMVMPIRVGSGDISGLYSIDGYIDSRGRCAHDIAELILQRYDINMTLTAHV